MELFFKGKEFVYNHHLTVPFRPLVPHPDKSIGNGELDGNLIIHGDNLHALKSLLPRYAGKVDCIFIDPPYNTGNESWCYNDNVNSPIMREWLSNNPVNRDDMLRHDKWCAMMWPRLKLLHELLTETGSLWMTLDDNEVHRARMILDEIFGEDNFVVMCTWQKMDSPSRNEAGRAISPYHDHLLCVAKDATISKLCPETRPEILDAYPLRLSNGQLARRRQLRKNGKNARRIDRPTLWYQLIAPDGTEVWPIAPEGWEGRWVLKEEEWERRAALGLTDWKRREYGWVPYYIETAPEEGIAPYSTIWSDVGQTRQAKAALTKILGADIPFETPKPITLVERVLQIAADRDSLVLDSFAGSGTTAHAVLEANRNDGGSRRFILVECEDYADTLTSERVRRVINGYSFTGKQKEEILREKLTWTKFRHAPEVLQKISGLEALHGPNFDRIKKEIKDGELVVYGEKDHTDSMPGLGGSFTFCTLGDPVDLDALLTGENLPDYEALGAWVFYTATNQTLPSTSIDPNKFYLGESPQYHVWLIYKPDMDFLKSNDCALTLTRAETISKTYRDKKHLVFAPVKFVPNKTLLPLGVEFAQLPYAIYRREQA